MQKEKYLHKRLRRLKLDPNSVIGSNEYFLIFLFRSFLCRFIEPLRQERGKSTRNDENFRIVFCTLNFSPCIRDVIDRSIVQKATKQSFFVPAVLYETIRSLRGPSYATVRTCNLRLRRLCVGEFSQLVGRLRGCLFFKRRQLVQIASLAKIFQPR